MENKKELLNNLNIKEKAIIRIYDYYASWTSDYNYDHSTMFININDAYYTITTTQRTTTPILNTEIQCNVGDTIRVVGSYIGYIIQSPIIVSSSGFDRDFDVFPATDMGDESDPVVLLSQSTCVEEFTIISNIVEIYMQGYKSGSSQD